MDRTVGHSNRLVEELCQSPDCGAAALPISAVAQSARQGVDEHRAVGNVGLVGRGQDREGKLRHVGVSVSSFKVSTRDTNGALFVMENVIAKKGGPPRHLHYNEDEYFYVVEGEFLMEIGGQRFELKAGDSILGPRKVPHAYAFVGSSPGRLLLSYAPANKMEEYFATREEGAKYSSDAERFRVYGMELLGSPIEL